MTLDQALTDYEDATETYASRLDHETALEIGRAAAKCAAIYRLMHTTNKLTDKAHSASSAEAVAETDPEYAQYLYSQRQAVVQTIMARTRMESARLCGLALAKGEF